VCETGRALRQALALGALSLVVAAAVHVPLIKRFARGDFRESFFEAAAHPGIRIITLEEAEDLWRTGGTALVLDARAEGLFAQGHIPGARNVPAAAAEVSLPSDLPGVPRDRTLVVYCEGGDCQSSLALARRLTDEGFKDVRVFSGGWAAWVKAGRPEERTEKKGQGEKKSDGRE
jgi:rhodanese-related sulfurtransferase